METRLYKGATCFKTIKGRPIDLMLTNKKHSFMKSQSFETGFSDHHHLVYTILKSTYVKLPSKTIRYRKYKNFQMEEFQRELQIKLSETTHADYQVLHSVIVNVLQKHAPLKQRVVRGNNIQKYKQQRNLIVNMNRKAKRDFYNSVNLNTVNNDRKFCKAVNLCFPMEIQWGRKSSS